MVCGTRIDTGGSAGRQVTEADGKNWAEKNCLGHYLTSAALGTGVAQTFHVGRQMAYHCKLNSLFNTNIQNFYV